MKNKFVIQVRDKFIDIDKQSKELYNIKNQLSSILVTILDEEPNKSKRCKIIDFVFKDKIEPDHENLLRKLYL